MPRKDYSKMFDTPEDRAKEKEAIKSFYRLTIIRATISLSSGAQSGVTGISHFSPRNMKHKRMQVSGVKIK